MKKRIVIFGTGSYGKKVYNYFIKKNDFEIVAFADNDTKKQNTLLFSIKIISPNELKMLEFEKIIIASSYGDKEIMKQLSILGIKKDKIVLNINHTELFYFNEKDEIRLAKEIMLWICDLFNRHEINYHIDHGTLLGITRDGQILPWDCDVDFAVHVKDAKKTEQILRKYLKTFKSKYFKKNNWIFQLNTKEINIQNEVIQMPCAIYIINQTNETVSEFFHELGEFLLDIKFKYSKNGKIFWNVSEKLLSCDEDMCFPPKEYKFENSIIKIPAKNELYLQKVYGKNWQTPIKTWTYLQYENIQNY